jgi:leader peptidase (prepilin peptidase)/N-methyltransferase
MNASILISALLGLVIGSFLNVVAFRVPLGRPVLRPPSACTSCGVRIRPADNIPVLSWFLLKGRCRSCNSRISFRYPLVEAGTAILFGTTAALIGISWVLPAYLWFVAVAVALTLTDLDHKRIPNRILYPGTMVAAVLLGIGALLDGDAADLLRALAGASGYFGFLLAVALLARGGFGFGDVKLAFLLGGFTAYRGWEELFAGAFVALLLGGAVAAVLMALRRAGRKDMLPFGPWLVAGAFLGVAFGEPLVDWYLG